ncbi:hypothetical protein DICPUDRAFT_92380 [Dictyostelium purpureum]|uniref:F-box domain-containing protein n=1 Tax=Dictyostelium purpureum TaxID=5786 RepID=F0ZR34_DICPU|nr:uncharacterized protein DICPUDRAFT_92380 [Dictyostelium purpureum]EGC33603.1 hypothetical protein DICPUDRAFT_92380 [Dictyostelium purpureum]|eukprot:XP_003289871.1 hypothetical protein DICPUDRAFT_92380 [Dictyostelium purpureum]
MDILYSYNSFNKKRNFTILEELPYDVLLQILSFLNPSELCTLGLVCRDFKQLADDDWIWRGFYPILKFNFCFHFQMNHYPRILESQNAKRVYINESRLTKSASKFIGVWSEKWCDVDVLNSTKISFNGEQFMVEYTKNKFEAEFQSFDGNTLKFKLTGGDSGWSFLYTLSCFEKQNQQNQNNNIITTSNGNHNQLFNHHQKYYQFNQNQNCNNNNSNIYFNSVHNNHYLNSNSVDESSNQEEVLHLHVLRLHDKVEFSGMFCSSISGNITHPHHFRNKSDFQLYLMRQEIQQLRIQHQQQQEIINSIQRINENDITHQNNNNENNNSSCSDSRKHSRVYAY